MPEVETIERPTNGDESWRYSDAAYLASADLTQLGHWRHYTVEEGEVFPNYVTRTSGPVAEGYVDRLRVHVKKGGRYEHFEVITAGRYARSEIEVTLEEGAHFELGGVTIGGGDKVQEFITRTIHAHPGATSNQVVRAVQWGQSTGNFLGEIKVARNAQKTDAAQDFKGLLLEAGARANAVPQLEIFADDVKCAPGATVGHLDEAAR